MKLKLKKNWDSTAVFMFVLFLAPIESILLLYISEIHYVILDIYWKGILLFLFYVLMVAVFIMYCGMFVKVKQ